MEWLELIGLAAAFSTIAAAIRSWLERRLRPQSHRVTVTFRDSDGTLLEISDLPEQEVESIRNRVIEIAGKENEDKEPRDPKS